MVIRTQSEIALMEAIKNNDVNEMTRLIDLAGQEREILTIVTECSEHGMTQVSLRGNTFRTFDDAIERLNQLLKLCGNPNFLCQELMPCSYINDPIIKPYVTHILILAATRGESKIVKSVLDAGADIHIKNSHGDTALTVASEEIQEYRHFNTIKVILEAWRRRMNNGIEKRYFDEQIEKLGCYDISVLEALVDFFRAVKNRDKDTVKKFLDDGMDVNAAIYDTSCIYNTYTEEEITAIEIAVTGNDLEMVKLLLEYDVDLEGDINIRKVGGNFTPLMIACAEKNMEMVKLLVEAGSNINVYRANTHILMIVEDDPEMTKFLKDRGATE